MLFVFEGVDGTGKTTIAKEVSKMTNIPYYNCFHDNHRAFVYDGLLRGVDESYADFVLVDLVRETGMNIILDRSYPSGWVYTQAAPLLYQPPMDRMVSSAYPGCDMTSATRWESAFCKVGVMFWIRTSIETARLRTRKEFTYDQIKEINRLYNEYFNLHNRFDLFCFNNNETMGWFLIAQRCADLINVYLGG